MTTLHEAALNALVDALQMATAFKEGGTQKARAALLAGQQLLAQQGGGSMAGFDRGYAARLIEALYDNGDPVSVDAAEEFERLLAASATPNFGDRHTYKAAIAAGNKLLTELP